MDCPTFIPVAEAFRLIVEHVTPPSPLVRPLDQALGQVLAADVFSPFDQPPFDNAAMDGYAFRYLDTPPAGGYRVIGEIAAGRTEMILPGPGECVRIFTGAPMAPDTDTVVQQEWVTVEAGHMHITGGTMVAGANVRYRGSHLAAGAVALKKGSVLAAPSIGFLAGLGIDRVPVYPRPRIQVIVTGSELVPPGQPLAHGQIFESNGTTLKSVLQDMGITPVGIHFVKDDLTAFRELMEMILPESDMVLISGGISVGDHDIVRKYMEEEEEVVEPFFYKVRQRPGKPLFFGRQDGAFLFALPGNPASVLTCFYEYVYPAIRTYMGFTRPVMQEQTMIIGTSFSKKTGLTFFLKARMEGDKVFPLEGQLSYIMQSYAMADCLIVLDEGREHYESGEQVRVHKLPISS